MNRAPKIGESPPDPEAASDDAGGLLNAMGEAGPALRDLSIWLKGELGSALVEFRLFGSRARGDWDVDSDVDIAVVVRGLTARTKDRILHRVAEIELNHLCPLSVLVLSEERFSHLVARQRRIALDILREGLAL